VKSEDTRDEAINRLLRRSMQNDGEAGVSPECLDAETLAAWIEGTLDRSALKMAEAHAAGCARCQSMAAVMIRTAPATVELAPWWRRSLRSAWLVPLTAGAAAVALWAIVPSRTSAPVEPAASVSAPAEPAAAEAKAPAQPALADRLEARADAKETASANRQPATEGRQAAANPAANEKLQMRPPVAGAAADAAAGAAAQPPSPSSPVPAAAPATASAPAAAPPARPGGVAGGLARSRETAGALMKQEAFALREVASPTPAIRWRLGPGGAIDRTEDGGATWTRLSSGVVAELTAGASPSTSICWVVGRNGTVLRSIDGRNWTRAGFPEATDLIAVEAVDASTATVSTSDGRRFRTANGGQSWIREPLQDF
jgi:hypothetical protein